MGAGGGDRVLVGEGGMTRAAVWAPLLPAAMVGTDRHAAGLPSWPGEPGRVIADATTGDAAVDLLRAAAVLAACSLAGGQGATWPDPLPAPAAEDPLPPVADRGAAARLVWAFQEGPARLPHAVCRALGAAGVRLPHDVLPAALEAARRSIALRTPLRAVLGERGRWLARHHETWRHAAEVDATDVDDAAWQHGTIEQRRAFLAAMRARDRVGARERLQAALSELPARERADLAGVLAGHLADDDEALLDALRVDRSREVRQVALGLLLRLPDAAHPRRACERLAALVRHERGVLRDHWRLDAPEAVGADWAADQIDTTRPAQETLGERGWWLYQLVRQVPLSWWTAHTGLDAAGLRAWADGTDWAEALLRGWRDVLFASPDPAWCEAFLADWPAKTWRDGPAAVLALLPPAARETHWGRALTKDPATLDSVLSQLLAAVPLGETLSAPLSLQLGRLVRERVGAGELLHGYALRAQLADLGCVLHADALDTLTDLPRHGDETAALQDTFHAAAQVVALRHDLLSLTSRIP